MLQCVVAFEDSGRISGKWGEEAVDYYGEQNIDQREFKTFVAENAEWFRGHFLETEETLQEAEVLLGVRLSTDLTWLLTEWGYGDAVGIGNLRESVSWTLRVRTSWQMPVQYVLLHDWQDAGIVLMDTKNVNIEGEPRVLYVTHPPKEDNPSDIIRSYATFADWCVFRLEEERDFRTLPDAAG